jgi:RNA polymerase sigma-70 factor, ECF subfamily
MLRMSDSDTDDRSLDGWESSGEDAAPSASEVRLVHAVRIGDHAAFGELVQRYERRVLKVIRRFIVDQELAADLVQESFVRAWERMEQFDPARRFGPWLFRLAVNLTYDHLRKQRRRGRWSLFTDAGTERSPDPAMADPRADLDLAQEVQLVLAEVPEAYRTVLVLRDLEGFCTADVATISDRSEATIRWRLAEARKMFREAWERRERRAERTRLTPTAESREQESSNG